MSLPASCHAARLKHEDGRVQIVNVEYNQLDPLLRAAVNPDGDVPDASGFSPYPGVGAGDDTETAWHAYTALEAAAAWANASLSLTTGLLILGAG